MRSDESHEQLAHCSWEEDAPTYLPFLFQCPMPVLLTILGFWYFLCAPAYWTFSELLPLRNLWEK